MIERPHHSIAMQLGERREMSQYHHLVYETTGQDGPLIIGRPHIRPTIEVLAVSKDHSTEELRKAHAYAKEESARRGIKLEVGFGDIGEPIRMVGTEVNLEHGITDSHHSDSNARKMRQTALNLAQEAASKGIPETRLTGNPDVWMS